MSLDAGRTSGATAPSFESVHSYTGASVYAPWKHWVPSGITHHAKACCEIAREWIVGTDFSALNGANVLSGPRWLRQRFEWGPGTYPIHWCEVIKKSKLDCGVLAALAQEVFVNRGVRCFRAQLVQEFSDSAAAQWRAAWENGEAVTDWIRDEVIYHEGCAILVRENEIKLWDSSAGWWVDPKTTTGYGGIRALRVTAPDGADLKWGEHVIRPGIWTAL
ncbi:MAG TPA: hypothetical protein VFZ23_01355 [Pyrinomonadaceae bacterium]